MFVVLENCPRNDPVKGIDDPSVPGLGERESMT